MEFLELNSRIRDYFHQHKFRELTPGQFLKNHVLQSPNLYFHIAESLKTDKTKAIIIDAVLNKSKYILANPGTSTIEHHLAGIAKGEDHHPIELTRELISKITTDNSWDTKEAIIEKKILGIHLYGWEIYLDGYNVGFAGYIERFAKEKPVNTIFFDISLDIIQQSQDFHEKMPISAEFSQYLYTECSKRLLFHLFDNYMDEATYCLSKNMGKTGFMFLMQCYFIYQLLILRGNISKTEKIGYDRKIASLIQKCVEGNITGGVPIS